MTEYINVIKCKSGLLLFVQAELVSYRILSNVLNFSFSNIVHPFMPITKNMSIYNKDTNQRVSVCWRWLGQSSSPRYL